MTDLEILTLCAFQEADGECDEGVAAVAQIALTRTRLGYDSNRTIASTVEWHAQFSWTEYSMVNRVYERVAENMGQELSRIQQLLETDEKCSAQWARCLRIVAGVMAGTFSGPLFDQLTTSTVLYDNLALASPPWVASSRHVVKIGHHDFFEPGQLPAGTLIGAHPNPQASVSARKPAPTSSIEVDL